MTETIKEEKFFYKSGSKFEIFRTYTDCLYAAYGTKWNGNAAAYNGSLYIAQDDRIRRFTPLECERLMGFPDNYTSVNGQSDTNRFQAVGNSWAVPVEKWLGAKINNFINNSTNQKVIAWQKAVKKMPNNLNTDLFLLENVVLINQELYLNSSTVPNNPIEGSLKDILQVENIPDKFYLSPQACKGILRRKEEKDIRMNTQLEKLMTEISVKEQVLAVF